MNTSMTSLEDVRIRKMILFSAINMAEAKKKLDKPLLRRKSELPTDVLTQKSLETYKVIT